MVKGLLWWIKSFCYAKCKKFSRNMTSKNVIAVGIYTRFICVDTGVFTKWKWWLGFAPVLMLHVCNSVSCIMYDTKLSDLRLIMSLYFFTHFYHHCLLNFLKWKVMIFRTNNHDLPYSSLVWYSDKSVQYSGWLKNMI